MDKLLIQQATIATSRDVFIGDVRIENGKIAAMGEQVEAAGAKILDARGRYLLPGGVDPHTHFDLDVGFDRASDNFLTGSIAAACGGTTTIIDHMAFGPAGCALTHQPQVYHQLARDCVVDYGFHGTIQHVNDDVLADMETLAQNGITSLKLYMTYDYRLEDADILQVLERAAQLGLTICVHCENHASIDRLRRRFVAEGKTEPIWHAKSRPSQSEAEAVFRILMLAAMSGNPRLYVVHLSTRLGLQAARLARQRGQPNIFLESCPQYLLLDDSLYLREDGLKYIMSPPLRTWRNILALWDGAENGDIDTLGTDHCPFFFATQKQRGKDDFTLAPGGAPGVELRMPLLFSEGFMKGKLTLPQVVRLCCTSPAEIFGIAPQKGDIRTGADADLVLFDPASPWTVHADDLHENVDYTPYEGFELLARPVLTLSRGEIIAERGVFCGSEGRGQFLHRMAAL